MPRKKLAITIADYGKHAIDFSKSFLHNGIRMTKTAKVISFLFLIIIVSLVMTQKNVLSYYLFQPQSTDNETVSRAKLIKVDEYNNSPPITFGNLLGASKRNIVESTESVSMKQQKIKVFLAKIDEEYNKSKTELKNNPEYTPASNLESFMTTPKPTLNPELINILAAEEETKYLTSLPPGYLTQTELAKTDLSAEALAKADNPLRQPADLSNIGLLTENPIKTTYTVVVLGDSMVDTLGKTLPHLKQELAKTFPKYSFALLNYGQGATDLENGLKRLTHYSKYQDVGYQPILSYRPDILIVESFAYNHWSGNQYDLDRQWLNFAKIIDIVKENSPETKIVFAATVAPNPYIYGDGVLNFPSSLKWEKATTTKTYLQNLVNFATSENYPLADAFTPSLSDDSYGKAVYIDSYDHLHPSDAGKQLFAEKIVEAIIKYKLIN